MGEHGATIVYADRFKKTETNGDGQMVEQDIPFMKGYTVFNCEQIDALPAQYYALAQPPTEKIERRGLPPAQNGCSPVYGLRPRLSRKASDAEKIKRIRGARGWVLKLERGACFAHFRSVGDFVHIERG